jgi:site-specific recombinase XerD
MRKIDSSFSKTAGRNAAVETRYIRSLGESWLLAGDVARYSKRTLGSRRELVDKLIWFLNDREIETCDVHALRRFFQHVAHGHEEPNGRWGNPRNRKATSSGTSATYDRILRAFFNWLVTEEEIEMSPMQKIPKPEDRGSLWRRSGRLAGVLSGL